MSDKPPLLNNNAEITPKKATSNLARNGFTFKQFFVAHDRCAMKVGTDGILLGAWSPINGAAKILDIGSGTGLIALMLAQRTPADTQITAVELDNTAAEQAQENIAASPWQHKIRLSNQSIQQFSQHNLLKFDLVVSNPPYFESGVACRDTARDAARYTDTLSHEVLLQSACRVLAPTGRVCLVLPFDVAEPICALAQNFGLFCYQAVAVFSREGKKAQRILLEFGFVRQDRQDKKLVINEKSGIYHCNYRDLTKDFYLFF
ncbi:MAG: tRNA1(Val) (adenine(37)-N6)-methyltransferase [Plesiomonas sp.]